MMPTTLSWSDTGTVPTTATTAATATPVAAGHPAPARRVAPLWRLTAVASLRAASRALDRLALRLSTPAPRLAEPDLDREFHAQAGAPEGALYVNGQLVGHLPGLERL